MFGEEYIAQYIAQKYQDEQHDEIYRIYVTDTLKAITENTARFNGGNIIGKRYWDIVDTGCNRPQRTSEDIISSVCETLNFLGKEEANG